MLTACQLVLGEDFATNGHYCSVLLNAGCEAGKSCRLDADDKPACISDGTRTEGNPCDTNGCKSGLGCDHQTGTCRPYCAVGTTGGCSGARTCVARREVEWTTIGVCIEPGFDGGPPANCDPASPPQAPLTSCVGGTACGVVSTTESRCDSPSGSQGPGDFCSTTLSCRRDLTCMLDPADPKGTQKRCRAFCHLPSGPCSQGQCTAFTTPLTLSGVQLGYCGP